MEVPTQGISARKLPLADLAFETLENVNVWKYDWALQFPLFDGYAIANDYLMVHEI